MAAASWFDATSFTHMSWACRAHKSPSLAVSTWDLEKIGRRILRYVSSQACINAFTKLQQEVNYHRNQPLPNVDVNLQFLQSLGQPWQTFQQSMTSHFDSVTPATLFSEVLAFQGNNDPLVKPSDVLTLHTHTQQLSRSTTNVSKSWLLNKSIRSL